MTNKAADQSPLGIIAGSGELPLYIAAKAHAMGRQVFIAAIQGTTDPKIEQHPHTWLKWGELGKLFKSLSQAGVQDLVIIGGVKRPNLKDMHVDFGLICNLPFIFSLTLGGDDSVLSNVVDFIEKKGFTIIGAHEMTADLGCMTKKQPSPRDQADIDKGKKTVLELGSMDIGQGAVVARDYVLCVEAAEGTDQMLERAKGLRQWGSKWLGRRFGVLVKWPKPHQELRIDMPTIGPKTVALVAEAGLAGICVAAGNVLMSDKQKTIEAANQAGIFIIGQSLDETAHTPSS